MNLAYSIQDACATACVGRTELYRAIRAGELRAVKRGRRTLILARDLCRWLESLPSVVPDLPPNPPCSNDPGPPVALTSMSEKVSEGYRLPVKRSQPCGCPSLRKD